MLMSPVMTSVTVMAQAMQITPGLGAAVDDFVNDVDVAESSRTDLHDDVVDVMSLSALDVVEQRR